MPTEDVDRTKRATVVEAIASQRFPYPSPEQGAWRTQTNVPEPQIGIQIKGGGWIYADIVVTEEPGHFIQMLALVVLRHEVTEAEAVERWLPLSKAGPLYLFVAAGQASRANSLCQAHGISLEGIRSWRQSPAFGVQIEETVAGQDPAARLFGILPTALRPRAYRPRRVRTIESYLAPTSVPDERPALLAAPAAEAAGAPADGPALPHMPPPSLYPFLIAGGMMLTAFGFVFPAELLGAGLAMGAVGALGWLREDVMTFAQGGHAGAHGGHDEPAAGHETAPSDGPALPHMPPPSLSPFVAALGMMLAAFGFVFPAELLGAGLTLIALGGLGWLSEDVRSFAESDSEGAAHGVASH